MAKKVSSYFSTRQALSRGRLQNLQPLGVTIAAPRGNKYSVLLVDKIDDNFYHYVFLFCLAFGNHQCDSYKGIIGYAL